MTACAFCNELERIYARQLPMPEQAAAIEELWDRAERTKRLHQAYARRRRRNR